MQALTTATLRKVYKTDVFHQSEPNAPRSASRVVLTNIYVCRYTHNERKAHYIIHKPWDCLTWEAPPAVVKLFESTGLLGKRTRRGNFSGYLNTGSQHTSRIFWVCKQSQIGKSHLPICRNLWSISDLMSSDGECQPPPRSSSTSDTSDAISVGLRDVETDENGGKALCNVNYNSPPPWPSSLLHLYGQKTAGSSQTKRNFQLRRPKATGAEITLQAEALFEFPLTRNLRSDQVVSHPSNALER